MRRRSVTGVVLALLAVACRSGEGRPIDWDRWFSNGTPLASVAQASRTVDFHLVRPDGLPRPIGIYASGPAAVAFVYDLPVQGRVVVLESRPDIEGRSAREDAYRSAEGNGRSIAVRIRHGQLALASESGPWAAIEWVEDGTQVSIQLRDGTREEAIAIADRL